MSRKARSARGDLVDFDLLAIKQQLAQAPATVGVNDRRRFIDEKDGVRTKQVIETPMADALSLGLEAAAVSQAAAE